MKPGEREVRVHERRAVVEVVGRQHKSSWDLPDSASMDNAGGYATETYN